MRVLALLTGALVACGVGAHKHKEHHGDHHRSHHGKKLGGGMDPNPFVDPLTEVQLNCQYESQLYCQDEVDSGNFLMAMQCARRNKDKLSEMCLSTIEAYYISAFECAEEVFKLCPGVGWYNEPGHHHHHRDHDDHDMKDKRNLVVDPSDWRGKPCSADRCLAYYRANFSNACNAAIAKQWAPKAEGKGLPADSQPMPSDLYLFFTPQEADSDEYYHMHRVVIVAVAAGIAVFLSACCFFCGFKYHKRRLTQRNRRQQQYLQNQESLMSSSQAPLAYAVGEQYQPVTPQAPGATMHYPVATPAPATTMQYPMASPA